MASELETSVKWQGSKATLTERAVYLLETGVFADVRFHVAIEGNVKIFPAHKLILSMGSPVFSAMFQFPKEDSEPITVTDISPNIFSKMLRYLYTDHVNLEENMQEVLELYYASKKYMIANLECKCSAQFELMKLCPNTVCRVYETASIFGMKTLEDRCATFMSSYTSDVLRTPEFLNAKQETVEMVLKMEEVSAKSESEFFSALLAWGLAECSRRDQEENPASLKVVLDPLIPYIRFLAMSKEEFTKAMNDAQDLFDSKDALAIYMKITNKKSAMRLENLPWWCNKAGKRRPVVKDFTFEIDFKPSDNISNFSIATYFWVSYQRTIVSTVDLLSLRNDLVIKGLKVLWLGLKKDAKNEKAKYHFYKLEASNLSKLESFEVRDTLMIGKEITFIFKNCIPVSSNQTAHIKVSVELNKPVSWDSIIEGERKTSDFHIKISCDNKQSKHFVVKELIYYFSSTNI